MNWTIAIAAAAILLVTPAIGGGSDTSNDDAAIRTLQQQHEEASRTHDAHIVATQFTVPSQLRRFQGGRVPRSIGPNALLQDGLSPRFNRTQSLSVRRSY